MNINLFFDLDGTLTDPKEGFTKSFIFALEQMGMKPPADEELLWCIGPPLHDSFLHFLGDKQKVNQAVLHYRERYNVIGMYENQVYAGIREMLSELVEGGCTLHLATSKLRPIAAKIMEHFALHSFFKSIHGSELDGTRGDKGELIAFILEQERLTASDCVMIGDRKYDMIGAQKNQVRGIGVGWGYGSHAELMEFGAQAVVSRPEELVSCLNMKLWKKLSLHV